MTVARSDFYVYQLIDPRSSEVFYVGKGTKGRVSTHAKCLKTGNFVKIERIKQIHAAGLKVIEKIVVSGLSEHEAFRLEKEMIASMKSSLTNIIGGIVTSSQSLLAKARRMKADLKSFDDWVWTCGQDVIDSVTRMYGSPWAYYQKFVEELDENIKYAEAQAA